jgi:hypothetical protein
MLNDSGTNDLREGSFRAVAEAAWAVQSHHDRFRFKKPRANDHPSRIAWAKANDLWLAQVRSAKAGRRA